MRSLGVSRPILTVLAPLATEMIAMTDQPLYAALDVSLEKTTLCVMAQRRNHHPRGGGAKRPRRAGGGLGAASPPFERIGLEAGPLSEWLVRGLAAHGLSAVLMETRQVRAALSAQDRQDRSQGRPRHGAPAAHRLVPARARQDSGCPRAAGHALGASDPGRPAEGHRE